MVFWVACNELNNLKLLIARGKIVDANQEMMALGLCNIFGSFFGSFPVNAMFTIAAVGNASGIKTQFAGIYTSIIMNFTKSNKTK